MADDLATRRAGRPQFAQIPHWVDDLGLKDGAFRVYYRLHRRAYRMGARQVLIAKLSKGELARTMGKDIRTVDRAVAQLEAAGAIVVHRSKGSERDMNLMNVYELPD